MKVNRLLTAAITIVFLLPALSILAQGFPGNPPGGGGAGAPIDGGAILLVISAAAYGYRKIRKSNKKINDQITHFESIVQDSEKSK